MTQTMRPSTQTKPEEELLLIIPRCYRVVPPNMIGSPVLTLQFSVNSQSKHLSGFGHITQATNAPLNLSTQLSGDFKEISYQNLHLFIVEAIGYQPSSLLPSLPNFKLLMVLSDDWKTGTAEYEYNANPADPHSVWHVVRDVEATSIQCQCQLDSPATLVKWADLM
jgi:hypothetical protein